MGVGLVMLGASMPLLVLPSSLTGVGAALCFMGVSCALAVTGTLPQVRPCPQPRIQVLFSLHLTAGCSWLRKWSAWVQLTEVPASLSTRCTPCSTLRELHRPVPPLPDGALIVAARRDSCLQVCSWQHLGAYSRAVDGAGHRHARDIRYVRLWDCSVQARRSGGFGRDTAVNARETN